MGTGNMELSFRILLAKDGDVIKIDGVDLVFSNHAGGNPGCWLMRKALNSPDRYLRLNNGCRALFYNRQEMIDTIINNRYIIDGEETKMIGPGKETIDPLIRIENAERELALAREALVKAKKDAETKWYDGMPVLVRDNSAMGWYPRYLKKVLSNLKFKYEAYPDGRYMEGITCCWEECKPDYDAPSRLTWIPNNGVRPKVARVLVKYKDGKFGVYNRPQDYTWDRETPNGVIEYAILVKE